MFKSKKKDSIVASASPPPPIEPRVFVDNELGTPQVFFGGSAAAWTQSFKIKTSGESSGMGTVRGVPETPDEEDDILNPAIDAEAWNSDWYREKSNNQDVMAALQDKPEGAFIIRDSASSQDSFALSYRFKGATNHIIIHGKPIGLHLPKSKHYFDTLSEFVEFYSRAWNPSCDLPCQLVPGLHLDLSQTSNNIHFGDNTVIQADADAIKKRAPPPPPPKPGQEQANAPLPPLPDDEDNNDTVSISPSIASKALSLSPSIVSKASRKSSKFTEGDNISLSPSVSPSMSPSISSVKPRRLTVFPEEEKVKNVACFNCGLEQRVANVRCRDCGRMLDPEAEPEPEPEHVAPLRTFVESGATLSKTKSILKRKKEGSTTSKNRVRFDESSIASTRLENKSSRGIHARLDVNARKSPYYLGPVLRNQAAEVLHGASDGAFVLFDSLASPDNLFLMFVQGGEMVNIVLENAPLGIHLKRSKNYFECVTDLVEFYCSDNDEHPNMLNLKVALDALAHKKDITTAPGEVGYEIDLNDYKSTQWFRGKLSNDDVAELIEFEPSGTFVVCDATPGPFVLHYVVNGSINQVIILKDSKGYHLQNVDEIFPSLGILITHYGTTASKTLPCVLRLPKPQTSQSKSVDDLDGSSTTVAQQPAEADWIKPNISKAEATELVLQGPNGSFVIRASESRKGCFVLTYRFGEFAHHELIQCTEGKGYSYFLEICPTKEFATLEDLVAYFEQQRPELRTKLVRKTPAPLGLPPPPPPPIIVEPTIHNTHTAQRDPSSQSANVLQATDPIFSPSVPRNSKARLASNQSTTSDAKCARVDGRAAMAKWCCLSMSKEDALKELPREKEGVFVIRKGDDDCFAILTAILGGKELHFPILDSAEGLHLKKSNVFQPNLSALVAYYKHTNQHDLPHPLSTW